jgi:hypothetical protein
VPLDWAGTQNRLGNVLARLGAREGGTARLEEAVAAYRDALKELTRERVPRRWAGTQNRLGNVLARLGAREGGMARLEEAVAAPPQAAAQPRTAHQRRSAVSGTCTALAFPGAWTLRGTIDYPKTYPEQITVAS